MKLPVHYPTTPPLERKRVREEYVRLQGGRCHHCGTPLTGSPSSEVATMKIDRGLFPPNFFKWPIHLHHNHNNGMTIGAVHGWCNAVLWQHHGE